MLSSGEGVHNNHHALPRSARMGMHAPELDLGWLVIRALEALRLVRGVAAWHRAGAPPPDTVGAVRAIASGVTR